MNSFFRSFSGHNHRVIILNRGSMFAFQRRKFSPPLSFAHRIFQCYYWQKRDKRRCSSRGIPPQPPPPATRAISQCECSLEWRHAVMLHILLGKICISFFLFYCEGMLSLVVLGLCGQISSFRLPTHRRGAHRKFFRWSLLNLKSKF